MQTNIRENLFDFLLTNKCLVCIILFRTDVYEHLFEINENFNERGNTMEARRMSYRVNGYNKRANYKGHSKFFITTLIFVIALVISIVLFTANSHAATDHQVNTYYTNIYVNSGDTLWSIAEDNYSVEYGDFKSYVQEIQGLNHLDNDKIHAGSYLIIPYCK